VLSVTDNSGTASQVTKGCESTQPINAVAGYARNDERDPCALVLAVAAPM